MKKAIIFIALALVCATGAYAQKQTGGEKNLEVQFAPLGGSPVSISGIRLRIFNSEASAIRLGLYLGGTTDKTITAQANENGPDSPELVTTDKTFDFSIRPGYEKHFAGTDRLSPYIGAEILFSMSSQKSEEEVWNLTDQAVGTITTTNGSTTIGLNAVAGTDFYFADNIYIGAEIGFGFASTKQKDTEVKNTGLGLDDPDPVVNGSSSGWGPVFQSTLRLGWLFN